MAVAKASQPIMSAISCTSVFVSRALDVRERNWESFAIRHGWFDMCTFGGRADSVAMMAWD